MEIHRPSQPGLLEALDALRRRRVTEPPRRWPLPGSPRIAVALAGLLAAARRQRTAHARLRLTATNGIAVLGACRRDIGRPATLACLSALEEATAVEAHPRHATGSFNLDGCAYRVEIYDCHHGSRAMLHACGESAQPLGILGEIAETDDEALASILGPATSPEDLLGAHLQAAGAGAASLLVRHADLTLLALGRGLPIAERMVALLAAGMTEVVRGRLLHPAAEVIGECLAHAARDTTSAGSLWPVLMAADVAAGRHARRLGAAADGWRLALA